MTIYSGFSHWKWWFSIVMLDYQRVMCAKKGVLAEQMAMNVIIPNYPQIWCFKNLFVPSKIATDRLNSSISGQTRGIHWPPVQVDLLIWSTTCRRSSHPSEHLWSLNLATPLVRWVWKFRCIYHPSPSTDFSKRHLCFQIHWDTLGCGIDNLSITCVYDTILYIETR